MALNGAVTMLTTLFPFLPSLFPTRPPESSITLASVSPLRSVVPALHIAVAAIVTSKARNIAIIVLLDMTFSFRLHLAERIHQIDGGWAKDGDKQRREQKQREWD